MTDNLNDIEYPLDVVTMVNDISVLNEWWLVSMPIPMEPQRQAIGNLIDLKSHCGQLGRKYANYFRPPTITRKIT